MVLNHGLGEMVLSGTVPGASFFIMMVVIIKSSPETINKIYFMLNERVNNNMTKTAFRSVIVKRYTEVP